MNLSDADSQVGLYYDGNAGYEWERLARHPIEYALTRATISEYGPAAPADILDVGGGPGRYAIWLAAQGHRVSLLDLSAANLELATEKAHEAQVDLTAITQGTATDLTAYKNAQFDAVLLLGPLYHLKALGQRQEAVAEAARVLRPGGVLFAAFLNRYALVRWVAKFEPGLLQKDPRLIESLLASGDAYSEQFPDSFSSYSYWAHPDEIEPLMAQAGLQMQEIINVEGAVAYIDEKINELKGEEWDNWVQLNYALGKETALHGAGIHLVYVGKRKSD